MFGVASGDAATFAWMAAVLALMSLLRFPSRFEPQPAWMRSRRFDMSSPARAITRPSFASLCKTTGPERVSGPVGPLRERLQAPFRLPAHLEAYFLTIGKEHSVPGQSKTLGQLSPVQESAAGSTALRPSGVNNSLMIVRWSVSDTFSR